MTDPLESLTEALADRYTIERELGRGGMATVHLARDDKLGREVALKVLRPDLAAFLGADRFLREIEIAAKLRHPNIVALHDYGCTAARQDGNPEFLFYVMPYVEGESLRDRLDREKQLPIDDALQITREVADALGYAHSMGVVHRDIKPENILFTAGHAVVSDFGIAKALTEVGGEKLTETGLTIGTPAYMSPEQGAGSGEVDARSDLYSLGCVLYEMLSGDAPYTASTPHAVLAKKQSEPIPRISVVRETVPPGVEATLTKALQKNPADRFVTAQQFVDALETPSGAIPRAESATKRKRPGWQWVVGVAVVVAVVAIGLLLFDGWRSGAETMADDDIDRLVIAPLENRTGDSVAADWGFYAAEYVLRALDQAAVVTVVPASVVRDLARDVDPAVGLSLDELASRTNARYAVVGSYVVSGNRLRFDVELVNAESGELERSLEPVSGSVDSLEAVFTLLAERITVATVTRLSPDLSHAFRRVFTTPPTLGAVRELLVLQDHFCGGDWRSTIDEAQRVLQETPDFAFPLHMLAYSYANLNRLREADSVLALLEPLSDQLSQRERLLGDRLRASLAGDHNAATRAAEQVHRMYPSMHAVAAAVTTNRFADAVERFRALDLDAPCNRRMAPLWTGVAKAYHGLGQHQEELDIVRDGLERHASYRALFLFEAFALAGLGRLEAVDSVIDVLTNLPPEETTLGSFFNPGSYAALVALELDFLGRPEDSKPVMDRALAWFSAEPVDSHRFRRGQALFWAERWDDADTLFTALLERAPDNLVLRGHRGVVLVHLGRHDEAKEIDRWLAQLDLPYLRGANTRWRAAIAAALGDREEAVRLLQQAYSEGMVLGTAQRREPEWRALRDYGPYQEFVRPK